MAKDVHACWEGSRKGQFSSVAQSCLTPCDPMNCSTPGLPVHHQLPEFTQTHVHQVGDAIQPSHPLLSPVAYKALVSSIISLNLLRFMSIESVMLPNHFILCHPLLLLPSVFPSIRVFSNESVLCIRWPKYQSFSFSISPSSEYSGLISFRTDWLDLLAVQETLKSLLQHHSSKASASASKFFGTQPSSQSNSHNHT